MEPNLKKVFAAVLFLFLGFNGAQQFVTPYFKDLGLVSVGFNSLILIYLFFALSNPFAALLVNRLGSKKVCILGTSTYITYILSLYFGNAGLVYIFSILLGIGASLFWIGQNTLVLRISSPEKRGRNFGYMEVALALGSLIGTLLVGFLSRSTELKNTFIPLAVSSSVAVYFLAKLNLQDAYDSKAKSKLSSFFKVAYKPSALQIAGLALTTSMSLGLVIGTLPVQIATAGALIYVGIIPSIRYIISIAAGYPVGKLSDKVGRKPVILFAVLSVILGALVLKNTNSLTMLSIGVLFISTGSVTASVSFKSLIGDIATENNLESITSILWVAQNIGVISALILGRLYSQNISSIYTLTLTFLIISLVIAIPFFANPINKTKLWLN